MNEIKEYNDVIDVFYFAHGSGIMPFKMTSENFSEHIEIYLNQVKFTTSAFEQETNSVQKERNRVKVNKLLKKFKIVSSEWPEDRRMEINIKLHEAAHKVGIENFKGSYGSTMKKTPKNLDNRLKTFSTHARKRLRIFNLTEQITDLEKSYGIELRPYQRECLKRLHAHLETNPHGYFLLPTGAGKTIIMIMAFFTTNISGAIVSESIIQLDQIYNAIKNIDPDFPVYRNYNGYEESFDGRGIFLSSYKSFQDDFQRSTPEKLGKKIPFEKFGLIFADESHHATSEDRSKLFIELKKQSLLIGMSASEALGRKKFHPDSNIYFQYSKTQKVFGEKIHEIEPETLINQGYLNPYKQVLVHLTGSLKFPKIPRKKDFEIIFLDEATGTQKTIIEKDYDDIEIEALNNSEFNKSIAKLYYHAKDPHSDERIFGKSTLVFSAGIKHADAIAKVFNEDEQLHRKLRIYKFRNRIRTTAVIARSIHSGMPRGVINDLIQKFKAGEILVLVGDKIFSEGFDCPSAEVGILLRPTVSDTVSTQRAGRLLRKSTDKGPSLIFEVLYPEKSQVLFRKLAETPWVGVPEEDDHTLHLEHFELVTTVSNSKLKLDWRSSRPLPFSLPSDFHISSVESSVTSYYI